MDAADRCTADLGDVVVELIGTAAGQQQTRSALARRHLFALCPHRLVPLHLHTKRQFCAVLCEFLVA